VKAQSSKLKVESSKAKTLGPQITQIHTDGQSETFPRARNKTPVNPFGTTLSCVVGSQGKTYPAEGASPPGD
jgi:hypothetical protein